MMSRSFAFRSGLDDIAEAAARHVEVLFETEAVVLIPDAGGILVPRGGSAPGLSGADKEMAVARWVLENARPAGAGTDTLPGADGLYIPLSGRRGTMGVLAVALGKRPAPLEPSQRQLLDVFVNQAALALERAMLAQEAERAQVSAETERTRSTLLSSVSHDLRTPLAAVTGAATSLLDAGGTLGEAARRDLLETIRDEADHLNRIVANLLEITRLESGPVALRKEWYPLEDLIDAVAARIEPRLRGREVTLNLPDAILQVPLEATLVEQVLINLLENALKYTPAGSPLEISARAANGDVLVEVADRGPGIPPGEEERIFHRYYRAAATGAIAGSGLGLAVCRAAVEAHGGRIWATNREGGGAVFRFTLPIEGEPPAEDHLPELQPGPAA
jgi:two-component system sensor histidine kinase KdpD